MISKIKKLPSYIQDRLRIRLHEKKFNGRMRYMFFDNKSDKLMIVFNAFNGIKPKYNYVKGLRDIKTVDYLYILDDYGYTGSYLLYENGNNTVRKNAEELIASIIKKKKYQKIITSGSSKGGTCAIYFGLVFNADLIFSGACQYNLGSYLHRPDHELIFRSMMGFSDSPDNQAYILNNVMPNIIEKHKDDFSGHIFLFYSKSDLTYERQLIDLIAKLKSTNYTFTEIEDDYINHSDVGKPFLHFLRHYLIYELK